MKIVGDKPKDEKMKRRKSLKLMTISGLAAGLSPNAILSKTKYMVPVEQLTSGEQQHWFGYYDKWQIDSTGQYALGMQVRSDIFRSPKVEDELEIGVLDLKNNNKWTVIGHSSAWGWQQGCMLQWIPGSSEEVLWNARMERDFVCIIYNIKTGRKRILPRPIYTLSPDGSFGLGVDFARLQVYRPGYGYATAKDQLTEKAPKDTGIYKIDIKAGHSKLIISYDQISRLQRPLGSVGENHHWINHLLINPSGDRFVFLNRSRPFITWQEWEKASGKKLAGDEKHITRAITASIDGSDIYALNDSGNFSHFIWKGDDSLCAWAKPEDKNEKAFWLFHDKSKKYESVGQGIMTRNGHNTYVPNTNYEWILNDTYPDKKRMQELYLYHVPTNKKMVLGEFYEPKEFSGEWRCDLHPRCNPQGTKVFFDSTHNGGKRQIYSMDISNIVKNE